MIATIKRKTKTALRQKPQFLMSLGVVWILLGLSRLAVVTLSFKGLARHMGVHDGLAPRTPLCSKNDEIRSQKIKKAIGIASRYTPWKSNCFPQAITARIMLGCYNIPYALFFGMRRDTKDNELKAHAWVVAGRVNVSGGNSFQQFTSVGCFVSQDKKIINRSANKAKANALTS